MFGSIGRCPTCNKYRDRCICPITRCKASRDGECRHTQCPQLRDNEPNATGRHCPLDTQDDED